MSKLLIDELVDELIHPLIDTVEKAETTLAQ